MSASKNYPEHVIRSNASGAIIGIYKDKPQQDCNTEGWDYEDCDQSVMTIGQECREGQRKCNAAAVYSHLRPQGIGTCGAEEGILLHCCRPHLTYY